MTRLYTDDAELYEIAFDWDISDEADWLVSRLEATEGARARVRRRPDARGARGPRLEGGRA